MYIHLSIHLANLFSRLFKLSIQSNEKLYILCSDVTARSLSMANGSKYRQVEQYIIKEIEKGNLRTGDQIAVVDLISLPERCRGI